MTDPTDFEKRAHEVLQESAGRLDGRTRSRLTQARHAALAQIGHPGRNWWRIYMPAGAAAAAVLPVVMWSGPFRHGTPDMSPVDDMDLLADGDAPDFVDDGVDLEFYEWAAGEVES